MTYTLSAQCDSTSEAGLVYSALNIDESLPLLKKSTLYLEADLDQESLSIIKNGISRSYYVRQRSEAGRIVFDTLRISDRESKELHSLVAKLSRSWTNLRLSPCQIAKDVKIYKKASESQSGINRVTHQIMEPIFLRDHTLAFAFYKREGFDKHAEFTILIKKTGKWELWHKVIIVEG